MQMEAAAPRADPELILLQNAAGAEESAAAAPRADHELILLQNAAGAEEAAAAPPRANPELILLQNAAGAEESAAPRADPELPLLPSFYSTSIMWNIMGKTPGQLKEIYQLFCILKND